MELHQNSGVVNKTKRTTTAVVGGTIAYNGSYEIAPHPTFPSGMFRFLAGSGHQEKHSVVPHNRLHGRGVLL